MKEGNLLTWLRDTSSTLDKRDLLAKYDNPVWREVFKYAYGDKTYGVRWSYINWDTIGIPDSTLFATLDKLSNRSVTGNSAIDLVDTYSKSHGDLIKLICNRDLDCGISETTLNAVYGNSFIPVHEVQLAKEVPLEKVKFPVLAQVKYDGVRVTAIIEEGVVTLKTRNGKMFSYPKLEKELSNIKLNCVLDGELIHNEGKMVNRTSVSGIVNSAIQGTPITVVDIKFALFDFLTLEDFRAKKCTKPYIQRIAELAFVYRSVSHMELVISSPYTNIYTAEEANECFGKVLAIGYEGLILKSPESKYTFKRSADWVKMKAIKDCELFCIDVITAEGNKYDGCIGALSLSGLVEGFPVKVNVGSGLTDFDRNRPNDFYLHNYITIKYNAVIKDSKTGFYSLFLPRFVAVRKDI